MMIDMDEEFTSEADDKKLNDALHAILKSDVDIEAKKRLLVALVSERVDYATRATAVIGAAERTVAAGVTFPDLLRGARQAKGWTQQETADRAGISMATYVRWEAGRAERPSASQVREVCGTLGIDPRDAAIALGWLETTEV